MGKRITPVDTTKKVARRPAITPEARENQMIALAVDLAERQVLEGTASSQVITHYLKLGSTKERIEKEILEKQKELITAKTEALNSQKRSEELYEKAVRAFAVYSGNASKRTEEDDEDIFWVNFHSIF